MEQPQNIFDQLKAYNEIKATNKKVVGCDKGIFFSDHQLSISMSLFGGKSNTAKKLKDFEKLATLELLNKENNAFNFQPVDKWGKEYYGPSFKQQCAWFMGGVVTTSTVFGFVWYCKAKK